MEKRFYIAQNGLRIILIITIVAYFFVAVTSYLEDNRQWTQNLTGVSAGAIALGDVNGDGYFDLILTGNDNYKDYAYVYINNGTSFNENRTWGWNLTAIRESSVTIGDIDNDGDLDLGLVGWDGSTQFAKIYLNNGSSFEESRQWDWNLTGTKDITIKFIDINNDGRQDVIIGNNPFHIYINNGTSVEESITWETNIQSHFSSGIGDEGISSGSITFGDYNNDGQIDMMAVGHDNGDPRNKLFENNGTTFDIQQDWQDNLIGGVVGGVWHDADIAWGDVDNDGDLDLGLTGYWGSNHARMFINNGSYLSYNSTWSTNLATLAYGSMALGDYNNDGKLDLIWTGNYIAKVYNNTGTSFVEDTNFEANLTGVTYSSVAWADIDNDGDLDSIITGYTPPLSKVYLSNASLNKNSSVPYSPNNFSNYTLANGNIFFGWNNGSDNETNSLGLYYNLKVGTTSGGNDIVTGIFGYSGRPTSGYFGNMMQHRNISLSGSRFQVGTTYYWSVQTIDTSLAKSAWSTEQRFTLTSDFTPPTVTANAPSDGLVTNQTSITFNATIVDDYSVSNVSLYGNFNTTWHRNETNASGINNTNYIFIKNLTEGSWLWGIRACDNLTNCRSSENYTIRIDTTLPSSFLMSPTNLTTQTSSTTVTFTYNVTDVAVNNCSLLLNNAVQRTNTSITVNTSQTFTETLSNGNYNWSVRCTDAANNINSSVTYSLIVSYTAPETPTSSSGGGGSSGATATTATNVVSKTIASFNVGNNLVEFTNKEQAKTGVEEILIESLAKASYVKISVEKLSAKPVSIESMPANSVYTYLKIDKTNLNNTDIKEAKIKFTINKTWMQNNNYDFEKVLLNRFTTNWEKLPTKMLSGGSQFYYYEATSPGFSVFAITAEKKIEEQKEIPTTENMTEETNLSEEKENIPQQEKTEKGKEMRYLALAAAIVMFITILLIIKLKKRKREKR